MRLFVAIDLPEDVKEQLAGLYYGLPGARWLSDEQMHLTLRFIGEVDGLLYRDIKKALSEIQLDSFDLVLNGVGCFPPRGQPNVLWVGVEKHESLLRLQTKIERVLQDLGCEPGRCKYVPHITLAYLKNTPIGPLGEFLTQYALFKTEPFEVYEFQLFSSILNSKGSIYAIEEAYPLD